MFKQAFIVASCIFIGGCQQLSNVQQVVSQSNSRDSNESAHNQFIAAEVSAGDNLIQHYDIPQAAPLNNDDQASNNGQVYGDVWKRIQAQLSFKIPPNRRLEIQRAWYAKHPEYLNRVARRAEPFLYYIVEEIEKRGLPMELALLPIVESAFDPFAYSHGSASGLWQFIPGTATRFGLKQDWWYDGRRDVVAATKAALDYLEKLHQQFDGNWLYALAAYNSGEGRVARAIQRNYSAGENVDFWSLELPKETDAYVPKLLALADIIKRPYKFDLNLYSIPNVQILSVVEFEHQVDLALAAKLADMPISELHALNPGYNRWATAPDGPHRFLLPIEKADLLAEKIKDLPPEQLISWTRYKIQNGDSLSLIAKKYNTTIDVIRAANKFEGNTIRAGQFLMIPGATKSDEQYQLSLKQHSLADKQNLVGGADIEYIVKKGDSFWDISQEYKVDIQSLSKWNNLSPGDPIYPGQKLKIKIENTPTAQLGEAQSTRKVKYKVRKGDSLARIAQKFKVSINDIENWNKLNRKKYLQPGQMLDLHVDITQI